MLRFFIKTWIIAYFIFLGGGWEELAGMGDDVIETHKASKSQPELTRHKNV